MQPNVVLFMADNLGWGELGCYGGGVLRGAPTPRIDALAKEGFLMHNYNVESDCVPTRSALMSGRHPVRTGCLQSTPAGLPQGLDPQEVTLAQLFKTRGYATAHYGKWHLGDVPGRYPSDRGFDHWYGIPRTTNESMFPGDADFDHTAVELPYIMEGYAGHVSYNVKVYDIEQRKRIDGDLVELAKDFMKKNVKRRQPFFLYHPAVHLHFPTLPHADFAGRTGNGNFADSMVELDHRVGQVLDAIDELGIADNTVFIFCSDNGPEFREPYRGTAGPWTGTYHTAMEGSLRVPFIIRWPNRIPRGQVSNEIVHCVDIFTTLATLIGADLPANVPIDGVDQMKFFLGQQPKSNRDGFLFFLKTELRAIKWRDWKLHFYWEPEVDAGYGGKLESPKLFNLTRDPKETMNVSASTGGWPIGPMLRFREAFWTDKPIACAGPPRVQPQGVGRLPPPSEV